MGLFGAPIMIRRPGSCAPLAPLVMPLVSGSQTFSDRVPFVGPARTVTTYHLEKFGKPELTQMQHEQNGCEETIAIIRNQQGK